VVTIIFITILSIFIVSGFFEFERSIASQKEQVLSELQVLSAKTNQYVTESIENGQGLIAYIKTFPDLDDTMFNNYASRIFPQNDSIIRHYTILKDTTITFVYPYKGNESAVGVNLAEVESQRETTLKIKEDNISLLVGPVDLVQGGRALINRMPIFIDDQYWGQLSLVLLYDRLLELIEIDVISEDYQVLIEHLQDNDEKARIILDQSEAFSEDAIEVSFPVANGSWRITMEPKSVYNGFTSIFFVLIIMGLVFSVVISVFSNLILKSNANLNKLVAERTEEISHANHELKNSLHQLETAQDQLVMREKHAALGELVAGVAHEINTPLGVCVTVNSYIQTNNKKAKDNLAKGELKKSDLIATFDNIEESTEILTNNLDRVSQLVYSFKKLATDQFLDEYKHVEFKEYLEYILKTISPTFKGTKHKIELEVDKVELKTYPGALFQVFTNLIMNSYIHGFDAIEHGEIRIKTESYDGMLVIDYYDNGKGISQKNASKIYDPFFTTKRHEGSTGLGMHIVYNIVFQKLMGSIELIKSSDYGVHFLIQIPLTLDKG
jgi:sensor domain CHASE-containing protein/two-component sensor histidine kinase